MIDNIVSQISRKRFNTKSFARRSFALEEDLDLKLITARKMAELRRRAGKASVTKEEKSNKEIVLSMLYDRGDEVLEAALARYPTQTAQVIDQLARMIKEGKLNEKLPGGDLLNALRSLGMRVSLPTTIRVEDHGKFVSLADKLRSSDEKG